MNPTIERALDKITAATNLSTGLSHPNDKNRAKEAFKILHDHGEILLKKEIAAWASLHGWSEEDADELGSLAQQIGEGKSPRIKNGPWWAENVYDLWSGQKR